MIELKTLYMIKAIDTITNISFGFRMPLGVNPGAIRFTNDPNNAARFYELDDVRKEIDEIKKHYPTAKIKVYEVVRKAYEILI